MVRSVGNDTATKTLRVLFTSGRTYEDREVPAEVYRGLMDSGSKGSYMNSSVIDSSPVSKVKGRKRR